MVLRSKDGTIECHVCDRCKMELFEIDHSKPKPWNERWNVVTIHKLGDDDEVCPRCATMNVIEADKLRAELASL